MQNPLRAHPSRGSAKGSADFARSATDQGVGFESYNRSEHLMFIREQQARQSRINGSLLERELLERNKDLMKTTTKSNCRIPVLLSILCAGLVTAFLAGCAESPYVAYGPGYYPAGYYRGYSYYDP